MNDVNAVASDSHAVAIIEFDGNNNPTKVSLPTGAASSASYEGEACGVTTTAGTATDLQQCGIDDAGNTTAYTYDDAGNQTSATDTKSTGGASLKKTYAKAGSSDISTNCSPFAGQLCSVTTGNQNVTRYLYDDNGNLSKITPPAPLAAVTYQYDSLGRMTFVTKGTGSANVYSYDKNDRFVEAVYGATAAGPETRQLRVFDADGNLHSIDSQTFDHDAQNRLEKVTAAGQSASSVTRDQVGNIIQLTGADATITKYTYNTANQPTSAAWRGGDCPLAGSANSALPSGCVKFGYDASGRRSSIIYPGNVTNILGYDKSGRVTSITAAKGGTTPVALLKQTYGYATTAGADRANVQTMVDNTGDFTPVGVKQIYAYDSRNRLTSVWENTAAGP